MAAPRDPATELLVRSLEIERAGPIGVRALLERCDALEAENANLRLQLCDAIDAMRRERPRLRIVPPVKGA